MTCDGSITALTRKRTKSVVRCELLMNDALLKKTISPELISSASESHLLIFLPLILDVIQATDGVSPLLPPLKARMLASRKLKLRFLLLRKHPAFKDFKARLRFSSAAYGQLPFGGDATKLNRCRALPPPDYLDHFTVPVDMVDLQTEDFFRDIIFTETNGERKEFGLQLVSHPFPVSFIEFEPISDDALHTSHTLRTAATRSSSEDDYTCDDELIQMAQVRDNGHQRVVELRRMGLEADEVNSATLEPLLPRLIVTEDEDVMITQATQVLFHLLNHFWLRPTEKYPDPESAPVCITFDAIATDERRGIYQAFCHVQSFSVFHFSYWRDTKGHDPVAVDHFVRTAAGAFTAAYIIGFHMRNGNDILVKDGEAVFLRGFQGIFDNNNNVGSIFDNNVGTRLTIPKPMKEAFHSLRVWDEFKLCCLRAFEVTRENHDEIFPMLAGLYSRCGVSRSMMYEHLSGKNSLNSSEKSARRSDAAFRKWLNR